VFYAVTAAAGKVAGSAIFSGGPPHALCDFVPVGRLVGFTITLKDDGLWGRVAGAGRKLLIGTGLFVTNQAIDPGLVSKVKIIVLPTITGVTGCATSLVAFDVDSEVVNGEPAFAQGPAFHRGGIQPCPVDGLVKL
jgi:hypothetical protein